MSDSEDDFASADEGEVHTDPKPEKPKGKDVAEISAAASKPEADKSTKAEAAEKDTAQKGGNKGGKNQKKKGTAGGKLTDSKNAPKSGNKPGDTNVAKSKAQKRNDNKGKKGAQKAPASSDKDSEKVSTDSGKKDSPLNTETQAEGGAGKTNIESESAQAVKDEKPVIVSSTEPDNTPKADDKKSETPSTESSNAPTTDDNKPEPPVTEASEDKSKTHLKEASGAAGGSPGEGGDKATLLKSPSSQSIARPEPDHTREQETVLTKLAEAATEPKSGWGWGWGSSLLNVASSSVTTFTSQVGEGFHTMMETVESSLNVPNPEEMAEKNAQSSTGQDDKSEKASEPDQPAGPSDDDKPAPTTTKGTSDAPVEGATRGSSAGNQAEGKDSDNWFSSWGVSNISNITKMVENTSKTLVTGGLDVLETIGKKTFDVINEHDPGLKKTRGFMHDRGDKPNLSATLRDAKNQYEVRVEQEKETEEARKSHFGALFDDFQGLAHLEALEMLSNQSEKQVNTLLGALSPGQVGALKPRLLQIKGNFEVEEEEESEDDEGRGQEFEKLVTGVLADLAIPSSPDKLIKIREKIYNSLTKAQGTDDEETPSQPKEVHQVAIQSLAEFTSKSIEHFHKFGELVLLHRDKVSDLVSTSRHLQSLTKILCTEVSIISAKFTDTLNQREGGEALSINQFVTNIYLEASNSCSYIQDGFQLLLPVLQQAAMEQSQTVEES